MRDPDTDPAFAAAKAQLGASSASPATSAAAANPRPGRQRSGRSSKPNSGRNKASAASRPPQNPPPAASGTRKTKKKGAKSAPATNKSHKVGRKGTAMPVKTAAELERELKNRKKSKGNTEDQALEYYKLWRRKKSDEDKAEVLELIQADKKAFKLLKPYLPQDMLDALEGVESGSGDTASGSSKLPKGMDKAAYDAAKAKAEQHKADGKTQGEIIFELAADNVHPDIIDHVIKEVCG